MNFESPGEKPRFRAGIFHGIHPTLKVPRAGTSLGQSTPALDELRQLISDGVADGMESGAVRAADKIEARYGTGVKVMFAAILIAAVAATVASVVLIASER